MPPPSPSQPTEVELEILGILWANGQASAREIHEQYSRKRNTNYSTTVKMLAVMFEKGMVKRDESKRPILFRSAVSQKKTQAKLLKNLVQKAYDGSFGSLVMQVLSSNRASEDELIEIRGLLDELEEKNK